MRGLIVVFLFCCFSFSSSAQRIAIMGALDQEIAILLDSMKSSKKVNRGGIDFYTGKLKGKKVVILKAGVGKVNSTYSTAVLTENFSPSVLIFTGVAGGLHPEAMPGDIVIGKQLVQYDFGQEDSTGFKVSPFRKLNGGRFDELYIEADSALVAKSIHAAEEIELVPISGRAPKIFSGVISTGDIFVSNDKKAAWLYSEFDALATEMEGAAIAHICRTLGIPFVIIRSCSDNANNHARVNFNQFVGPASVNSARLVLGILEEFQ